MTTHSPFVANPTLNNEDRLTTTNSGLSHASSTFSSVIRDARDFQEQHSGSNRLHNLKTGVVKLLKCGCLGGDEAVVEEGPPKSHPRCLACQDSKEKLFLENVERERLEVSNGFLKRRKLELESQVDRLQRIIRDQATAMAGKKSLPPIDESRPC